MGNNLNKATAVDLEAAAQSHANATWGWGITAAVVWYFWGWGWAVIPGVFAGLGVLKSFSATTLAYKLGKAGAADYGSYRDSREMEAKAARGLARVEELVNSYGKVLERVAGQDLADSSLLPAPKATMKAAMLLSIKHMGDPQQREVLKAGYVLLSMFQGNIGRYRHEDLMKASLTEAQELLQELQAQGL